MSAAQQSMFMVQPVVAADPYFANVSLLMHMDGVNGGTSFIDSSLSPKTVTVTGNVSLSTTQFKYGTASGQLSSGTGNALLASSANFLYRDIFTLEFWIYRTSNLTNTAYFMGIPDSASQYFSLTDTGVLSFTSGSTLPFGTLSLNQWYFVTVSQDTTTRYAFLDGNLVQSSTKDDDTLVEKSFGIFTGTTLTNFPLRGCYLDEIRFTKGIARYTATFTPPTAPFPNS